MDKLFEEVNKIIPEIIGWIKIVWKQFSGFIINANDKVDLTKQSIAEMIRSSGWIQLVTLGLVIGTIRIATLKIFKRK